VERSCTESRVVEALAEVSDFSLSQGRKLKLQSGDDMSVISETPSVFTNKITHAEKNLTKMDGNRAKELE
jgi:hypothetical protein